MLRCIYTETDKKSGKRNASSIKMWKSVQSESDESQPNKIVTVVKS